MRRLAVMLVCLGMAALALPAAFGGEAGMDCPETRPRPGLRPKLFWDGVAALAEGDPAAAEAHFDRALAEDPNEVLMIFVGSYYREGYCGISRDFTKEASVYRRGADRNTPGGLLELALMTWSGVGVPEDREAAIHLFRHGLIGFEMLGGEADIPNLEGLVNRPVPPELLREFEWVRELATTPGMGIKVADELLAKSPPDPLAACRYMALSFDRHKDAETAYRLGMMHSGHQGVAPSHYYAVSYLASAAAKGYPAASYELARRMVGKEVATRYEWEGLAELLRSRRLGYRVKDEEVEAARRGLSQETVREAELQARLTSIFRWPAFDGSRKCVKAR